MGELSPAELLGFAAERPALDVNVLTRRRRERLTVYRELLDPLGVSQFVTNVWQSRFGVFGGRIDPCGAGVRDDVERSGARGASFEPAVERRAHGTGDPARRAVGGTFVPFSPARECAMVARRFMVGGSMQRDVQIVSAVEFARRSVEVPARFRLRFPSTWRASPVQNRYADAIERQTLRWLASHGIGNTAEERRKLQDFQCGMYGGYSLPLADHHTGLLVTEFISLWLFWDDAQVEEGFGWTVDAVVAALVGPCTRPANRYIAAWADLGARLRATQSERWLNLVLVEAERSSLALPEAFAHVVAIHNHEVGAFDRLVEQLADRLPELDPDTCAQLRGWVQAVRHNVYGFALWESTAQRYQEYKAIAGPLALIAPVTVRRSRPASYRAAAPASTNGSLADLTIRPVADM